ncbi:hypothetical protein QJS04_geneDACA011897 [Acorus gramineus]|uniref:Uncharacterized protein n=1 Tax=Acorus gramineus TaxID=55184 RepID=A0AAV9AK00_ACOGR|nr:hypothetical protein QJS04_geneDACA011897 [Acorus gramineus]
MATTGTGSRRYLGPLLAANLVECLVVLGLAGWSIDKYIDQETHHHLGGNESTNYLLVFALLAGVLGSCSVLIGLLHLRAWKNESLASAVSSTIISCAITALAFGVACKQIRLGNRGRRLRTLEAFIVILALTELIYLVLLHAGFMNRRYGPGYRDHKTDDDPIVQEPPGEV